VRILIIGGGGFVGQKLALRLAELGSLRGAEIAELALADISAPTAVAAPFPVTSHALDIADREALDAIVAEDWDVIYHLAAVVSAQAEADFVAGMRTNFFGTFNLLEACRGRVHTPVVVYASSVASYSTDVPQPITDWTATTPQTSYGTQKAIGELLLNDYSRRGFVDGRGVRLPTVVVRPGKPNAAASSFFSSIIREPLQGDPAMCPVATDQEVWLASPRVTVENLVKMAEIDGEALGGIRTISLPGMTITVAAMLEALGEVAGENVLGLVDHERDPAIEKIVQGWAGRLETGRAEALGLDRDEDFGRIIRDFMETDMRPAEE